ncbi:Metallo-dependent phosphatase-like protein [Pisolithus albus]|nr:Metallo-dependent phosphatase-like protein [Pisolithus albus]
MIQRLLDVGYTGKVSKSLCLKNAEIVAIHQTAREIFLSQPTLIELSQLPQSLETILLLLCYKIKFPENFFLLRGNREYANVAAGCNIKTWKSFVDVFNCLPIAAVVASKIFCRIQRPTDVPDYGLLNDLLWSDPSDTALDWEDNEHGVSYCFGKGVINDFMLRYDMDLICRAHMIVEDGCDFYNQCDLRKMFFSHHRTIVAIPRALLRNPT